MTPTIIEEYILPALIRYIDRYQWWWSIAKRIIKGTEAAVQAKQIKEPSLLRVQDEALLEPYTRHIDLQLTNVKKNHIIGA
ncbi:MAG: hypothetical protein K2M76_04070 [Muribaculaceae bacterium]|nr:hypothetical protein [Muribaculaceae bacterium]